MNRSELTFFLLGKKYGFDLKKMLKFVNENQYWDEERILQYQVSHFQKIIKHAYEHTAYYRSVMDERGLKPSSFQNLSDLKLLPIIGKQIINQRWNDFIADNANQFRPMHRVTSGTTGLTFKYYIDTKSWALNWATKMRTFSWGGYIFGKDKIATLKGGSMLRRAKPSLNSKIWKYLNNNYDLSVIHLSDDNMENYYQQILDKRILYLRGFPSAVYTFAKYISDKHGTLPLKATFTSAEYLQGFQRKQIEETFCTKHIDAYGCGDGMAGANQCEQAKGYHINIETSIMEITNKEGGDCKPGEEGEIVLTSLHDYAMPLIRYTPGDIATVGSSPCSCGRTLPLLDKIVGRTSDLIILPNGRTLNGIAVPFADWVDKISKFQLWQIAPDVIVLKIVPKDNLTKEDLKHIEDIMHFHLGEGITFKIDIVNDIPLTESGKYKYVISKVPK